MRLGKLFPVPIIKCYEAHMYAPEMAQSNGVEYVVLDKRKLVYAHDVGERHHAWEIKEFKDINDFIRHYYKGRLHGEFATYPIMLSGDYNNHLIKGKKDEWVEKSEKIRALLINRLENQLKSYRHLLLKFSLGL